MDRLEAFQTAKVLVDPIIEEHGLHTYKNGPPFGNGVTYTPVEQHISEILRVADWLLEGGQR